MSGHRQEAPRKIKSNQKEATKSDANVGGSFFYTTSQNPFPYTTVMIWWPLLFFTRMLPCILALDLMLGAQK